MSFIEENLMPNEQLLFKARVHLAIFLRSIITFIFTFILFLYGMSNAVTVSTPDGASSPPSMVNLVGSSLICLSVMFFLVAVIFTIQAIIIMVSTEFGVSNRRIIAKAGFIRRNSLEILLSKVESVSVNQTILGRLLNFGTVMVTGTGGTSGSFRAIVNPIEIRKEINLLLGNVQRS
jgi:uncharacterized membrane protein YdbT with pleckstrin-like domain